ncbi:MAG: lipid II flippase MurJ, partial [Candidatus Omnitrophica bacterium]|nr:lipid II flippase MurJ [Candidatus Omnitrophota bacterium]
AKKNIYHPKIVFRLDKELRDFLKIISFQIVSMVAIGLNPVVDQTMASWLNIGSVSILQYAEKLYQIPVVFILSGFIVVILSRWSEQYHKEEKGKVFKKEIKTTLLLVFIFSLFLMAVLAAFSGPIVRFVYCRGEFPVELLGLVKGTFIFYLLGVGFYLMGQVMVRAHLVKGDTKVLMKAAFLSNFCNISLNLIFMKLLGIKGLALSTSITSLITFVYLLRTLDIFFKKRTVSP